MRRSPTTAHQADAVVWMNCNYSAVELDSFKILGPRNDHDPSLFNFQKTNISFLTTSDPVQRFFRLIRYLCDNGADILNSYNANGLSCPLDDAKGGVYVSENATANAENPHVQTLFLACIKW